MTIYAINLPNDYNSEADARALVENFPGVEATELAREAFDEIDSIWPGLQIVEATDFGYIMESSTTPPENLPRWVWVTEVARNDDGQFEEK